MLRRIAFACGILVLLNSCTGCGREEPEGPAPTHWSQTPQPITPSPDQVALRNQRKQALDAAMAFAQAKYGSKLDYRTAKFESVVLTQFAGLTSEERAQLLRDQAKPTAPVWSLKIQVAKLIKSAPQVDPTNPNPFPISHHVFLIARNLKVTEGEPLHIPSFALTGNGRAPTQGYVSAPPSDVPLLPPDAQGPQTVPTASPPHR